MNRKGYIFANFGAWLVCAIYGGVLGGVVALSGGDVYDAYGRPNGSFFLIIFSGIIIFYAFHIWFLKLRGKNAGWPNLWKYYAITLVANTIVNLLGFHAITLISGLGLLGISLSLCFKAPLPEYTNDSPPIAENDDELFVTREEIEAVKAKLAP